MWRIYLLIVLGPGCLRLGEANFGGSEGSTAEASDAGDDTTTTAGPAPGTSSSSGGSSGGSGAETTNMGGSDTSGGPTPDGTGDAESSTGVPGSICGDSIKADDEECEAPEPDCLACIRSRTVFTTAATYTGGAILGLYGADSYCKQAAAAAKLANADSYSAWLSDSSHDARDRIFLSDGRYLTTTGLLVAEGRAGWLSGTLLAPIDRDEHGQLVTGGVWTGTRTDGLRASEPDPSQYCDDWSSDEFEDPGYIGGSKSVNAAWTLIPDELVNPTSCAFDSHLYCIEGE